MRKRNKKKQIADLKYRLAISESKLRLFKEMERLQRETINQNFILKRKVKHLEKELAQAKSMLFNYETLYLAH